MRIRLAFTLDITRSHPAPPVEHEHRDVDSSTERAEPYPIGFTPAPDWEERDR